ncbi:right-handed parallel beta-helix repeat-containing protein [bacterium]|nr:right-handed parallel beta-helix repeat-containing protein [bacterium]
MRNLTLLLALVLLSSLSHAAAPGTVVCTVSPAGNDAWSGKLAAPNKTKTDGPVATLAAAQKLVRAAMLKGAPGPLQVVIRGGTYALTEPLAFGPQDSGSAACPIVYVAMKGETPVFSGGARITGWRRGEGKLWVADVPGVKSGDWTFHQLFVGGQRRTRARTPNEGTLKLAGTLRPLQGRDSRSDPATKQGFIYSGNDLQRWDELDDVNVIVYHAWTSSRHWIKELDEQEKIVRFRAPSGWPIGYWDRAGRYFVENFRAALDSPGEWYLSRAEGRLYYWPLPGEDMTRATVIAPRLQHLLEIKGDAAVGLPVSHVTFNGLSFQYADWQHDPDKVCDGQAAVHTTAAVVASGALDCRFEGCEIAHVGEYALILGDGCKRNRVQTCHVHDLGGGGVRIGGTSLPNTPALQAERNTVDNCFIHDGGYVFEAGIGVWIGRSSFNTVSHNEICDLRYSGCSVGWSWGYAPTTAHDNLFEYNHIHNIGKGVLSDMGGIYSLGISPGTVERFNHIHDVYSYSYGGWGLYTDEGSSDMVLENNLVYNTKTGGFHQHYGQRNTIRNNIFAYSWEANIISARTDLGNDLVFERNVVLTSNGTPLGGNLRPDRFTLRSNLYWDTQGSDLSFYGLDFPDWQAAGKDEGSIVADPLFVNAPGLNFRLRSEAVVAKIGFKPFDVGTAGLYGDPKWVALPKGIVRPAVEVPKPPPPLLVTDDFETTKVGDQPANARVSGEENGASIRVTDATAGAGKHSLRFTDAPGLDREWQPHMVYQPRYNKGTVRFSFRVRMEPGAILWHEWRDSSAPYKVGPSLRIMGDGAVVVGNKTLTKLPLSQWVGLDLTCPLGKQAGTWQLVVTAAGAAPQTFADLTLGTADWRLLTWMGFISLATDTAVFTVDDMKMEVAQ